MYKIAKEVNLREYISKYSEIVTFTCCKTPFFQASVTLLSVLKGKRPNFLFSDTAVSKSFQPGDLNARETLKRELLF